MAFQQRDWATTIPIAQLPIRGRAVASGVIDAVTIVPTCEYPRYSAILTDLESRRTVSESGTCRLRLVWLGRRRVPGIVAGTRLRVEGMVSLRDGLPTIYNPRYEIIGTQES